MTITVAEPVASPFAKRYRALSVGLTALIGLVAFEYLAVATAMPVVGAELDGLALYGLAFSGPAAAGLIASVLAGRWSDTRGPAAPIWTGLVTFTGGLVLAGLAPSMDVFVAARFLQGFGGGLYSVAIYVVIARVYPASLHPRVFAITSAAWVVPSMIGPAITGTVTENFGWRWVFLAVPVLALPPALLLWRGLAAAGPLDRPAAGVAKAHIGARLGWAALTAVGAALMQYGAGRREDGLVVLAAGAVLLAVALPRLLPAGTLRMARGLPTVIALRGIAAGGFLAAEIMVPLMLTGHRGLSLTEAGLVLTGGALTWSLASWVVGRKTYDRVVVLRTGATLIGAGVVLIAATALSAVPVALAFVAWMVAGFGIGLVYPTLSVLVLELSLPDEKGENSASLSVGESVYTVVAVAITGTTLAAFGPSAPVFVICFAVPMLMAAWAVCGAGRVTRRFE
jgi:MFS family permease